MKSSTIFPLLFLIAAILLMSPVNSPVTLADDDEIAVLTQQQGAVRVRRGNRTLTITQTTLLKVNDEVDVGGNGRAVIYQAYAPIIRLKPNERKKITQLNPPAPPGGLKLEDFLWCKIHYANAKQKRSTPSPQTQGGPDDIVLTLIEPRNSVVLENRPTLQWTGIEGATSYTVNLYDRNETVIWVSETAKTQIAYPESSPALKPGQYKWDVTVHTGNRISGDDKLYDASSFTVLSEERAAEIRNELSRLRATTAASENAPNVVYISALLEQKLYPRAQQELRKALESAPTDQSLWELLMETYFQMKLWRSREMARQISDLVNPTPEMVNTLWLSR